MTALELDEESWEEELERQLKTQEALAEIAASPAYSKKPLKVPHMDIPCAAPLHDWWWSPSYIDREFAIRECYECPLQAQCLLNAKEEGEEEGIWGGEEMGPGPKQALPEQAVCPKGHVGRFRKVYDREKGRRINGRWLCEGCNEAGVDQHPVPLREAVRGAFKGRTEAFQSHQGEEK